MGGSSQIHKEAVYETSSVLICQNPQIEIFSLISKSDNQQPQVLESSEFRED